MISGSHLSSGPEKDLERKYDTAHHGDAEHIDGIDGVDDVEKIPQRRPARCLRLAADAS